jgi:hypothetical protein
MKKLIIFTGFVLIMISSKGQNNLTFDNPKIQEKIKEILGEPFDSVLHAKIPFDFGWDNGGRADVYLFKKHIVGTVYITGDLIGKKQQPSDAGNYELMICHRSETDWGADLISNLAYYTLDVSINSGEIMDLGGRFLSDDSKIVAVVFEKYSDFKIDGKKYGLLLIIGITKEELQYAESNGGASLIKKLKENKIYPYTDLNRNSVL